MTFKEYLDAIQLKNTIFCIEEHCNGKYINTHLVFGFDENDENGVVIENKDNFMLYGDRHGDDTTTFINTAQQIEFVEESIYVTDHDDNRICLTFFMSIPIPHPKL
jgi:hypothetical protein